MENNIPAGQSPDNQELHAKPQFINEIVEDEVDSRTSVEPELELHRKWNRIEYYLKSQAVVESTLSAIEPNEHNTDHQVVAHAQGFRILIPLTEFFHPDTLLRGGFSEASGLSGRSLPDMTVCRTTPLLRSSLRMTLAKGHVSVSYMSQIRNPKGSSLLPIPSEEMMGIPLSSELTVKSILHETRSIASAI